MVDHEKQIYTLVTNVLKDKFENIQTTNQKLRFYQGTYPAVSFVQTNHTVMKESLSFDEAEHMCFEEYELEIQSEKDMNEIRNIMSKIDEKMSMLGYMRIYCGLDTQDKETKLKRFMRYVNVL